MAAQADGTTTVGFNAPVEEKAILQELGNYSAILRECYLVGLRERYPKHVERILEARRKQAERVRERRRIGAAKRLPKMRENLSKANTISLRDSEAHDVALAEGIALATEQNLPESEHKPEAESKTPQVHPPGESSAQG